MLIKKDIKNKANSRYYCDRCKEVMSIDDKVAIYTALPTKLPRKRWDLCRRCFRSLYRGIEKSKINN